MAVPYFDLYGEINNGAHRKAADLIGAPAFVWHQALWNPAKSENNDDKETRKDKIDNFIRALHRRLINSAFSVTPSNLGEVRVLSDDRVRAITFQFIWQGMRALIRLENHTEYITITSAIDASRDLLESESARHAFASKSLDQTLRGLVDINVNKFCIETHRGKSCKLREFRDVGEVNDFIYREIWEQWFFPRILNVNNHLVRYDGVEPKPGDLGARFADFRGFVTCEKYPSNSNDPRVEEKENPDISQLGLEFGPIEGPFHKKTDDIRGQWQRVGVPNEAWARRRLDNVWPFLSLSLADVSPPLAGRIEFTVSRLLEGRMLYASALAPQPERPFSKEPERPLYFYLHSVTQCERQIGRMVDRLCQLGTLRLAAIIALPEYKLVGKQLSGVGDSIVQTRKLIHDLVQNTKGWEKKQITKAERESLEKLENIQTEMSTLSKGRPNTENGGLGEASLEYRLLRSLYYRNMFVGNLEAIRVQRIEGYQHYVEFVRRRLDSAFNFIGSLEARVNNMRAEWRAVDSLYLTTAITILAVEIERQQNIATDTQKTMEIILGKIEEQGEISTITQRDTRSLLSQINRSHAHLVNLQQWGEVFLFFCILPYYIAAILLHMSNCADTDWCARTNIQIKELHLSGPTYEQWLTGLPWLIFAYFGVQSVRRIIGRARGQGEGARLDSPG